MYCCNKKKIQSMAYKLNGSLLDTKLCKILSMGIFIFQLFTIDVLLRTNVVSKILFWFCGNYICMAIIIWATRLVNFIAFVSIYDELKIFFNDMKCKCVDGHIE